MSLLKEAIAENPRLFSLSDESLSTIWSELLAGLEFKPKELPPTENADHLAELSRGADGAFATAALNISRIMSMENGEATAEEALKEATESSVDPSLLVASTGQDSGGSEIDGRLSEGRETKQLSQHQRQRSVKLVKEVFVCGASALELQELLTNSTESDSLVLYPKVLHSSGNESTLSKDIVPKLCFPTDIEVEVTVKADRYGIAGGVGTGSKGLSDVSVIPTPTSRSNSKNQRRTRGSFGSAAELKSPSNTASRRRSSSQQAFAELGDKRFVTLFTDDKSNMSYGAIFVVKRSLIHTKLVCSTIGSLGFTNSSTPCTFHTTQVLSQQGHQYNGHDRVLHVPGLRLPFYWCLFPPSGGLCSHGWV